MASPHPHVDALIARMRTEGAACKSPFLAAEVTLATAPDLRAFLETWSEWAVPLTLRCGPLTFDRAQPRQHDRIPLAWKHEDYGCSDMVVCDTFEAIALGSVAYQGEMRVVYTRPDREAEGIMLMPWWDERGAAEGTIQIAPSLEALLSRC
jgi:hypothetical protein